MWKGWRNPVRLMIAALLLSSCSSVAQQQPPASPTAVPNRAAEHVTIGFGAPEFERALYEPLIDAFNAANPDIEVQFVSLDDLPASGTGQVLGFGRNTREIVSAADTAAVFGVSQEDITNGYLYNLAPLIDADAGFDRDDYYPGALDPDNDGAIYLLPRSINVPLIAYNRDLWSSAGLPDPAPGWSWNDLLAAAEQLAERRGDEVERYGLADRLADWRALVAELAGAGIDLTSADPLALPLDTPDVAAAVERVAGMLEAGALYVPQAGSPDELADLIRNAQVAIWPASLVRAPDEGWPFEVGVAPSPPQPALFTPPVQGYIMSSGTEHPQQAWRWLEFLSRQQLDRQGTRVVIAGASLVPARASLAESSGFWDALDPATAAALRAALEAGTYAQGATIDTSLYEPLRAAVHAVADGERTAEEALRTAYATIADRVAQVDRTPTAAPDVGPIVVERPGPEPVPADATIVSFAAPEFIAPEFRRLAQEFNRQNPELYVQVESIALSDEQPSFAGLAAAADCFSWWSPPPTGQITATLDLRPLIDSDPALDLADFPAAFLAPFEHEASLRGLPHGVNLRVLNYNREAFDAAGLEYPRADWTLDDFRAAAAELTRGDEETGQYGFASLGALAQDLLFLLSQSGVALTSGSGDATRPNFTDPDVVAAVRDAIELVQAWSPHTELTGYTREFRFGGAINQLVDSGRVGMWFDVGGLRFSVVIGTPEQPTFTTAIAPPPLAHGVAPQDVRLSGLYISARAQQPQACWEWLTYLSNNPASLPTGFNFPARISVAESAAFTSQAQPGASQVFAAYLAALVEGAPRSDSSDMIDYFWFFRAVDRALQGADLEAELAEAQRLTEEFAGCVAAGEAAAACATAIDPHYQGQHIAEQGQ